MTLLQLNIESARVPPVSAAHLQEPGALGWSVFYLLRAITS